MTPSNSRREAEGDRTSFVGQQVSTMPGNSLQSGRTPSPHPSRIFLWLAPIIYALFALLTPPFQTPDEQQHLFRAWQLSELQLFPERRGQELGGNVPVSFSDAVKAELGSVAPFEPDRPVPRRPILHGPRTDFSSGQLSFANFFGSASYPPVGYVPQVFAIWIGRLLDLSVENILRLGRLLNAGLAIWLIAMAIRLTPWGGLGLMWVGLLPMSAASSAAFGQDGMIIGSACLLFALGLDRATRIKRTSAGMFAIAALTTIITLSKAVYLPLGLVAGFPRTRSDWVGRRLLVPACACVIAILATGAWMFINPGVAVPGLSPARARLSLLLHEPTTLPYMLYQTYIGGFWPLFHTAFKFGWVTVGPSAPAEILTVGALICVLATGDSGAAKANLWLRTWVAALSLAGLMLISAALYLYWKAPVEGRIQGLQGRYFIPVITGLLLAVTLRRPAFARARSYVPLLMIGANICALITICLAFYSF